MPEASAIRRSAILAIAGGLLVFASVAAELMHPVQAANGTTREPVLHAAYLAAWIVGWALIAAMALALHGLFAPAGGSRKATIGGWLVLLGAGAFAVSGIGQLIGLAAGVDVEALFALFLVAFPLMVVGCILLGLTLRAAAGWVWVIPIVGAAGFLVALLADVDPFHDIGLLSGALALAAMGMALQWVDLERTEGSLR